MKHTIKCHKCEGTAERVAIQVGPEWNEKVIVSWFCRRCGNRFVTVDKIYKLEEV